MEISILTLVCVAAAWWLMGRVGEWQERRADERTRRELDAERRLERCTR